MICPALSPGLTYVNALGKPVITKLQYLLGISAAANCEGDGCALPSKAGPGQKKSHGLRISCSAKGALWKCD